MLECQKNNNKSIINLLTEIAPELKEMITERYEILRLVDIFGPIGRRALSEKIDLSERIIRKESDLLKEKKLLETSFKGMSITEYGKKLIDQLNKFVYEMKNFERLENDLEKYLGIKKVIVAPTNSDDKNAILSSLGKTASNYLLSILKDNSIVGVTGGTTIESVINEFDCNKKFNEIKVVPARGSLGNKIEYQANTLAEMLANKLNGRYRLLFTPDKMSKDTIERLKNEPEIEKTLSLVNKVDTVLFGVGKSDTMIQRRGISKKETQKIKQKNPVAEAFGYYFDSNGEIVYEINTIGIGLYKLKHAKNLIAVAGGLEKLDAILAICKLDSNIVLVTDEIVAKKIKRKFKEEKENGKSSN
mgnify:CR=1 FL=1